MREFDFETVVSRRPANLKRMFTPREILERGNVSFDGAEPDYPTAPVIREAAVRLAENGLYGFTLMDAAYQDAVCWWIKNSRGTEIRPEWIVPTLGTVYALSTAVRAFTSPGDGVIVLFPSYYRHDRAVLRNGRRVVPCKLKESEGRYTLNADALAETMRSPENKLLVLCHPHNPTGHVFTEAELQTLAGLARETGTIVFSDEIFADITAPEHPALPFSTFLPEQTVACVSLGKTFNFTGVNQANAVIHDSALRERYLTQRNADHFGSIDPFFYQAVAAGCTEAGRAWVTAVRDQVMRNAQRLETLLKASCPGVRMSPWEGGYIAWLDVSAAGLTGDEAAERLEKEQAVLVDPGSEYGAGGERFIRLNLATQAKNMDEFAARLSEIIRS